MKRAVIVHCWGGHPDDIWYPWLERQLEIKGFEVHAPIMPGTDSPDIDTWVAKLKDTAGEPDDETYFIGHSIGCQAIMRYLENATSAAGGAVFVGGWFTLSAAVTENEEERQIAAPWVNTPINTKAVRDNLHNLVAIFSDDDPCVPIENAQMFEERLCARTIVLQGKGHFDHDTDIKELPIVLEELARF